MTKLTVVNAEFLSHEILKQMRQKKQTEDLDSLDMYACFRIHRMLQYLRLSCHRDALLSAIHEKPN